MKPPLDSNLKIGARIRKLRRELKYNQAQFAEKLNISHSYLNLLENNHRRLSLKLLVDISKIFAISPEVLIADDDHRLFGECMEVLSNEAFDEFDITNHEIKNFVAEMPNIAKAMVNIARTHVQTKQDVQKISHLLHQSGALQAPINQSPNEIIIDFMQNQKNYFQDLEDAALRIRYDIGTKFMKNIHLIEYLNKIHGVQVIEETPKPNSTVVRHFDESKKILILADNLITYTKHFQLAYIIAWLSGNSVINMLIKKFGLTDAAVQPMASTVFCNYLAAAILMPYENFLQSAMKNRYDIELLQNEFRVSFEQICHRLSTLNHPDEKLRGIPLHFFKTDRAGNMSKRFSLSGILISRLGSACPRWNIYNAIQRPEELCVDIQQFPDGTAYMNISQAIKKGQRGYAGHHALVGICIGCEISHAHKLVYADRLDITNRKSFQPIGIHCRICEWQDCPERAYPSVHSRNSLNPLSRGISPFDAAIS